MGRKSKDEEVRVSNQVESFRVLTELSRQELADAVCAHYQTIGYIERGEYSPSLVLALRIANALDTTVDQLFSLEEE